MPVVISGRQVASDIKAHLKLAVERARANGIIPHTAVIVLDLDPNSPSNKYVKMKKGFCEDVGIKCDVKQYDPTQITEQELLDVIADLNSAPFICGILVQLPLPKHINENTVISAINPNKDLDGMHPTNLGLLKFGTPYVLPCAPMAAMKFIDHTNEELRGKKGVVIGCSRFIGDVIVHLLNKKGVTTTSIDIAGQDHTEDAVREADVIVTATGKYKEGGHVKSEWLKEGCIVIDVATHNVEGKLRGDVDPEAIKNPKVKFITTVPGGVGPVTVAMVAENALQLALAQQLQRKLMLTGFKRRAVEEQPHKKLLKLAVENDSSEEELSSEIPTRPRSNSMPASFAPAKFKHG